MRMQAWFTILFSYPLFYQEFTSDIYKRYFVGTMANDTAFVTATYAAMVPEPHGPELELMDTTDFFKIPCPKAYISLTQVDGNPFTLVRLILVGLSVVLYKTPV